MKINLPVLSGRVSLIVFALMAAAAISSLLARPTLVSVENAPDLETTVPRSFGDWKTLPNGQMQVGTSTADEPNVDRPYDQTVMRSYINSHGQIVMLALAWGKKQQQEVKVHRPDLCYVAQGYEVRSLASAKFKLDGQMIEPVGKHMIAFGARSGEAVSYWIRIGSLYSEDAWATRMHILKQGFSGRIPDGILVRASQPIGNVGQADVAWPVLDQFLSDLVVALPPQTRDMLIR